VSVHAIWNPRAGVAARRALDALRSDRSPWKDAVVRETTAPGDAQVFAAEAVAGGAEIVLSMGGDGTANETARGLLGSDVPLGIVPVGSGNGLARALRVPLDPPRALAALAAGTRRRMDVGTVNGKPFLNVAGVGFDAVVGWAFHMSGRDGGRRGILTYVRMSVSLVRTYRPTPLVVQTEKDRFEASPFVLVVANGPQYGAGALINPGARLDDGRLEIAVFDDASLPEIAWNAPRLFLGSLARSRRYRRIEATRAVITPAVAVEHHRDGEPEPEASRLDIALRPLALNVLVPRGAAEDPQGPFGPPPRR
jgi:YegS/Rv2252/BmrU family lipid kinase